MSKQSVAAAIIAAAVIVPPPRSPFPPRMLLQLLPSATQAPPHSGKCRGGGKLLVKLAQDTEQWGGWVREVIWGGTHIVLKKNENNYAMLLEGIMVTKMVLRV
jgi:hypothetical protein